MASVTVHRGADADRAVREMRDTAQQTLDSIAARAFALFSERGAHGGGPLGDWLAAERELSWPAGELAETEDQLVLRMALPGVAPDEVHVTVTPGEIFVRADSARARSGRERLDGARVLWSEFRDARVCRRVALPAEVRAADVRAVLQHGVLVVTAPKASVTAKQDEVASAA